MAHVVTPTGIILKDKNGNPIDDGQDNVVASNGISLIDKNGNPVKHGADYGKEISQSLNSTAEGAFPIIRPMEAVENALTPGLMKTLGNADPYAGQTPGQALLSGATDLTNQFANLLGGPGEMALKTGIGGAVGAISHPVEKMLENIPLIQNVAQNPAVKAAAQYGIPAAAIALNAIPAAKELGADKDVQAIDKFIENNPKSISNMESIPGAGMENQMKANGFNPSATARTQAGQALFDAIQKGKQGFQKNYVNAWDDVKDIPADPSVVNLTLAKMEALKPTGNKSLMESAGPFTDDITKFQNKIKGMTNPTVEDLDLAKRDWYDYMNKKAPGGFMTSDIDKMNSDKIGNILGESAENSIPDLQKRENFVKAKSGYKTMYDSLDDLKSLSSLSPESIMSRINSGNKVEAFQKITNPEDWDKIDTALRADAANKGLKTSANGDMSYDYPTIMRNYYNSLNKLNGVSTLGTVDPTTLPAHNLSAYDNLMPMLTGGAQTVDVNSNTQNVNNQ